METETPTKRRAELMQFYNMLDAKIENVEKLGDETTQSVLLQILKQAEMFMNGSGREDDDLVGYGITKIVIESFATELESRGDQRGATNLREALHTRAKTI